MRSITHVARGRVCMLEEARLLDKAARVDSSAGFRTLSLYNEIIVEYYYREALLLTIKG